MTAQKKGGRHELFNAVRRCSTFSYDESILRTWRILFHHSIDLASDGGFIQLPCEKSTAMACCMRDTRTEF
jgi:hypothetical protein